MSKRLPTSASASDATALYLSLIKKTLTRQGFQARYRPLTPAHCAVRGAHRLVQGALDRFGLSLVRERRAEAEGDPGWSSGAETMIGAARLDSLQRCIEQVLQDEVPGDLIETGVWRGGSTIFMRAVLKAYGVEDRTVWAADSFQGLPRPDPGRWPQDAGNDYWKDPELAVSLEVVKSNFRRYELLDDQVQFIAGWFRDTLPAAPMERLAILRLDGDLYESTMVALEALYPRLSVGGFLIIDDYALPECRAAVDDFRRNAGVTEPVERVDYTCIQWRRTTTGS